MRIATLWHTTLRAVQNWWKDNCLRLAASLAYYTALSLAPLLLLIVGVVGLVLDRQQVATRLATQLEGLMGQAGRELVTSILTTTSPQGSLLATVVGLVTLFIGATAVFGELQATMNLIWEVQPAPTSGVWAGIWAWLRARVFSLAIVFALAFLLLVSLVISAALAGAAALFQGPEQAVLSHVLEIAVSLLVLTFVFALLYKYVPDAEIGWRDVWMGGFITAVLGCVYFETTPSTLVFHSSIEPCLVSRFFLQKPVSGGHEPWASRRIWTGDCVDTPGGGVPNELISDSDSSPIGKAIDE